MRQLTRYFTGLQLLAWIILASLLPLIRTEEISKLALSRAILHHGDPALFGPLHRKLRSRECVNIAVIGSSVTAGHGLKDITATYPRVFIELANRAFPCNGQHNISVIAKSARASDYWIDFLVGRQEVLLKDMDLVIVDTSMNDIHELVLEAGIGAPDPNAFIRTQTEILMALLLHTSRRALQNATKTDTASSCTPVKEPPSSSSSWMTSPTSNYSRSWTGAAVLWLGTSTRRTEIWKGPLPRSTDAVHMQLPVTITHGVPYVSIIDGLGPFASPAAQHWLNNTWYLEPVMEVHPGVWGHHVLATMLLHFLTNQHWLLEQLPWREHQEYGTEPLYCPRPPVFAPPAELEMYLDASPLQISTVFNGTTEPRMARCEAWSIQSDVSGKPGLLSTQVGTSCTILAFPEDVLRHPIQMGQVHVLLLKSYEHMGVVRVTVAAVPAVPAGDGSGNRTCSLGGGSGVMRVLGSREVDCLWGEHVSEARVEVVPIERLASEQEVCLAFTFEVMGSNRAENKVKVMGLTVF